MDPIDAVRDAMESAMRQTVDEKAETVRQRLSVPVGIGKGPRGGTVKIRSKPGEPPRKDTGRLQKSITSECIQSGDGVLAEISTDVFYAPILDPNMQRLIFSPEGDSELNKIVERLNAGIDKLNGAI